MARWLRMARGRGWRGGCRMRGAAKWRWGCQMAHAQTRAMIAYALFASASHWGWVAFACPAAMLVLLFKVMGIPATEAQAIRSRGDEYREYQRTTSAFVPWFRKRA